MVGRSDYVAHDGDKSRIGLHLSFMNQKTHLKKLGAKDIIKSISTIYGKTSKTSWWFQLSTHVKIKLDNFQKTRNHYLYKGNLILIGTFQKKYGEITRRNRVELSRYGFRDKLLWTRGPNCIHQIPVRHLERRTWRMGSGLVSG